MSVYVGKYPVFVSHVKEVEQLINFTTDLQHRLQQQGLTTGEKYRCLVLVRMKCRDLLLKLYAEETDIMLMDDLDRQWMQKIVGFVNNVIRKDARRA